MSTKGEILYHPVNGTPEQTWDGFSWPGLLFGGFWLMAKQMWIPLVISVIVIILTDWWVGAFLWLALGLGGNGLHKATVLNRGYLTKAQYDQRYDEQRRESGQAPLSGSSANSGSANEAAPSSPMRASEGAPKMLLTEQLERLAALRERGMLTEAEFEGAKQRVMRSSL